MLTFRSRHGGILAGAAALLLFASACGEGTSSEAQGTSGDISTLTSEDVAPYLQEPTSISVDTPVSKAIPPGAEIVWLTTGYPQAVRMLAGLEEAAEVLDWNVTSIAFDPANPPTIGASIESALAKKPDAIVMVGLVRPQYEAYIDAAKDAGIPLIPAVTPDDAVPGVFPVLDTDVQQSYLGKILAQVLTVDAAEAGAPAHVVELTSPELAVFVEPINKAVEQEILKNCKGCTYDRLEIPLADTFAGKHPQQLVSYLQRHPDVNATVSNTGTLGTGLGAALGQAGMNDVTSYGIAASNVQIEELQGGAPGAWAVQPFKEWGWVVADHVARVLVGDDTNAWAEDHLSMVVTADNAQDVDPDTPDFPDGYPEQFKELWGK